MNQVDKLVQTAGLTAPRGRAGNLAFFQVRGDCLSPAIQDGDIVFATWRMLPVTQVCLAPDEMAVFLVRWPGTETAAPVLKRWSSHISRGEPAARLACNGGEISLPGSQVSLLANHVRLTQRGGSCNPALLSGTVYAGLDLWFREDVARILASTYETMAASMRGAPPRDPETAEAYQQGFSDALRAVAVAFGVAVPGQAPALARRPDISRIIDAEPGGRNGHLYPRQSNEWGG